MQVSDFLGKKVLDKNAMEIGKVSDVDLMPKEGVINGITISTGELWIRNKSFEVKPENIAQIGDYVVLNLEESEIEKIVEDEEEETPKKRVTLTKID
ncbi:PRC-barrel domain-containing protein [Methanobacterium oryzae]|uniref:PRC-barrel domain-containing protein n=1 Tax=Methanobacterium oryzae TaxID=69540 RepID=UPI003D1BDC71